MVDPLGDVKVLEMTQMLAGPHVGMHLADLGADVIKIEKPGRGEIGRNVKPRIDGESYYYLCSNRDKKSVTLDLKSEEGKEVFFDLIENVDVILENFSAGTVSEMGIGYDAVSARNEDVIYCSISGFGQTGPLKDAPAVGHVIQAFTGVSSMTKDKDGHPLRVGVPLSDLAGAMYALQAILAAIRRRDKTGEGDYLDVALSDSMLSFMGLRAAYSHATEEPFPSVARNHVYFAPDTIYETVDGHVQVSIVTERQWQHLCEALDRPELADESAFETVDDRLENLDQLNGILRELFQEKSTDYWLDVLHEHDIPSARLHNTRTIWEDEHIQSRGMREEVSTPNGKQFPTSAYPVKHSSWDQDDDRKVAALGENTEQVLLEHGYSDEEITRLNDVNAI